MRGFLLPEARAIALIEELTTSVSDLSPTLIPALADLGAAHTGTTPEAPLLGWSNGPHPLLTLAGDRMRQPTE